MYKRRNPLSTVTLAPFLLYRTRSTAVCLLFPNDDIILVLWFLSPMGKEPQSLEKKIEDGDEVKKKLNARELGI